jgi:acyl dehydratase
MHVDPEKAASGRFGGLIASGWHTAALMMRLLADNFLPREASLASPGIDELRWLQPVRPGDVLRIRVSVLEATRSRSRPDRGIVRTLIEVLNQRGEVAMSLKPMNIIGCRSTA